MYTKNDIVTNTILYFSPRFAMSKLDFTPLREQWYRLTAGAVCTVLAYCLEGRGGLKTLESWVHFDPSWGRDTQTSGWPRN